MHKALALTTLSPEETRIVGAALAPTLLPGDVVSLSGDLGAGKTAFVQGLAAAMGVTRQVTSPTFTIVHEYEGRYPIVHLDVYRLDFFQEVLDLGFEEYMDGGSIVLVEWGEAIAPLLPSRHLEVFILGSTDPEEVEERRFFFNPKSDDWVLKLEAMRTTAEALLDAASPNQSTGERFGYAPLPRSREHRGPRAAEEE
ncbi:MAG: tRNA (adenosine(37)-N6)-threonylcarbamoyltransferase complex ATPase subunit type 1 TsaE [Actinobacteria bacterium]|nr:tRNA (adenosine(37)-N6)-threonylcarbamoyltransferase complex ATPase subunit type 1 TsaE [Actinomycetota bacterium]